MELLKRRYLCIGSLLFVLASFLVTKISISHERLLILIISIAAIVGLSFVVFCKKHRFAFSVIFICILFTLGGLLNSYIFISLPEADSSQYIGKYTVELKVISPLYSTEESSEYEVKLKQVGDEVTDIKANLHCDFPSELSFGDRIVAIADIDKADHYDDKSILLNIYVEPSENVIYKKAESSEYVSLDGIGVMLSSFQNRFCDYIDRLLDGESGALLKGFLISDTSDLSAKTKTDFRRSGVSHLLSVSGFHMAVLLGGLDLLLQKLRVFRKIRCFVIIGFGIFFLALTGFAGSAVRSALMLFAVYAGYIFAEDSDGLTSLFAAIFLIVLFSPYSIYDLGLFMSFCATLGLLSVYPYFEEKLPRLTKKQAKWKFVIKNISLNIVKSLLVTVIATFFLIPIMWYFFGEMSLVFIPTNLLLAPLSAIYLPIGAITLAFGKVPLLGNVLIKILSAIGWLITEIAQIFAAVDWGVISFEYPFVWLFVLLFAVSTVIMLLIKLNHKFMICIPAISFVLLFSLSVGIFSFNAPSKVSYINKGENDFLLVQKGRNVTVCDISSSGNRSLEYAVVDSLNPMATEIDNYIVTDAHKSHSYVIENILRYKFIKNLYLPLPSSKEEQEYVKSIYDVALQYNTHIIFYRSNERYELFDNLFIEVGYRDAADGTSVYVNIFEGQHKRLGYTDENESKVALENIAEFEYFLFGEHGTSENKGNSFSVVEETKLVFSSNERYLNSNAYANQTPKYILKQGQNKITKIVLPLS